MNQVNDVVERLNSDVPFWLMMVEKTNQPYFEKLTPPANKLWMTKAYTDTQLLGAKQEELKKQGVVSKPVMIHPKDKFDIFMNLYDSGVETISLDDSVPVSLEDIVEVPQYDGYGDPEKPLLNHSLSAALNYFYQKLLAGNIDFEDAKHLFHSLKNAYFLAPVFLDENTKGDNLDSNRFLFPTMHDCYGKTCIPIFSDWRMFCDFMTAHEVEEGVYGGYVMHISDLMSVANENNQQVFLLNPNSVSMRLTHSLMQRIPLMDSNLFAMEKDRLSQDFGLDTSRSPAELAEQIISQEDELAEETVEEDPDAWMHEDATPDFLKDILKDSP